ncbi:hypothetical protein OESDEN_03538 [Oesophagostomum dentatum]|uniref:Receptor L-domain domain-containing protein n=1 Tax=Oesophagostomum dentatum TaxID=61180 RepID=A0A0B1TK64_OESDE|nr:hypothetical protein OESDEN_03538 [Oesophagostomum dentatum]
MIYGNKNLVEVQFSDDLNLTTDDIYIKLNPNLVTENIKMTALQVNISNDEGCTKDSLKEDKHCIALIGEINFNEISPREWKQIGTVEGLVHVKNSSIQNLDDLKNLTIIGWECKFI